MGYDDYLALRVIMIVKGYIKINYEAALMAQLLRICLQWRGHQTDPWSGTIPRAAEQLGLCTTTTKAMLSSTHAVGTVLRPARPEPGLSNQGRPGGETPPRRDAPAVRRRAASWRAAPSHHS